MGNGYACSCRYFLSTFLVSIGKCDVALYGVSLQVTQVFNSRCHIQWWLGPLCLMAILLSLNLTW